MSKKLVNAVNNASIPISKTLRRLGHGGCCLIASRLGYDALVEEGIEDIQVHRGHRLASVNKGEHGLISSGGLSVRDFTDGNLDIHYWLFVQGRIVDFSNLMLNQAVAEIDEASGIATGKVKLSTRPLVSKALIKTISALKSGEIGYHYEAIDSGFSDIYSYEVSFLTDLIAANDDFYETGEEL